ncbi:MAG: hypothetical protein DRZ90_12710 [Spirochaetes bacterium]|nr:MAG: hypothetical protein DRZ90_12710 [Spirochaetota bacterium]
MKRLLIISLLIFFCVMILPASELSQDEISGLHYMFEEEKLAGDVYKALDDIWNLRIFENISQAEDRHMSWVRDLSADYCLVFNEMPQGEYSIPALQSLYDDLLDKGSLSIKDAMEVGRLVEITDIEDLDRILQGNLPDDYRVVYENLRTGSEHHLDAFNRQLGL